MELRGFAQSGSSPGHPTSTKRWPCGRVAGTVADRRSGRHHRRSAVPIYRCSSAGSELKCRHMVCVAVVGCDLLPPPPPPKMRTAPAVGAKPKRPPANSKAEPDADEAEAPRGPDSAPEHFQAKFETSKGDFVIDVHRHWAPRGADRFYQL